LAKLPRQHCLYKIYNGSNRPISDVELGVYGTLDAGTDFSPVIDVELDYVPPCTVVTTNVTHAIYLFQKDNSGNQGATPGGTVGISFKDANGITWTRYPDDKLVQGAKLSHKNLKENDIIDGPSKYKATRGCA
jgi:hypothetical protein